MGEEAREEKIEVKKEVREGGHNDPPKGWKHSGDGYFISKRSLWLLGGGALGALAAIGVGKVSKKIRPAAVGAVKEGYAFKEWFAGKVEKAKEDLEDIVAEAKHAYHKDLEASAETVKREKEVLQKVEEAIEKKGRSKRKKPQKEGE